MEQKLGYSSAYCSEFQPLQKINWQTCKMEQKPRKASVICVLNFA